MCSFKSLGGLAAALAVALLSVACETVTTKQPAGEKVAALDEKLWNGTWQDRDGEKFTTRIKDAATGLVEMVGLEKEKDGSDPKKMEILLRTVGQDTVANMRDGQDKPYQFARVAITKDFAVVFRADAALWAKLIESGKVPGTRLKDSEGKITGSSALEQFTEKEIQALEAYAKQSAGAFRLADIFERDPMAVLFRVKEKEE